MNKHELQTIKQEAQRYSKDIKITPIEDDIVHLSLACLDNEGQPIGFYATKRKGSKKFSLMLCVEHAKLIPRPDTLVSLQGVLRTYGLLLSQDAVICEESSLALNKRIRNMAQALIGVDGIRRFWLLHERKQDAESKTTQPTSNSTDDSTSR